jgi:hypothetical protein
MGARNDAEGGEEVGEMTGPLTFVKPRGRVWSSNLGEEIERDASACVRWHLASAVPP